MTTRVILADSFEPRINQVRAICEDWTRAGLIRDSIWLDYSSEMYEVTSLTSSGREVLPTAEWLSTLPAGEPIQIVVLQPLFKDAKPIGLAYLIDKIQPYALLNQAIGQSINLICPFVSSTDVPRNIIHSGRLNLIGVPLDSVSPGAAELVINENSDEMFSHLALNLCSAASLWIGVEEIKRALVGDMQNIQLQKTYVRYVDASELVDEIVASVLTEAASPVSRVFDIQGIEYDALTNMGAQAAVKVLTDKFMEINKSTLQISPEKTYVAENKQARSLWQAIKMYFEFLFKYLRKAPGRWAREKIAEFSKRIATTANRMIFGDDSAYEVVFNGITGSSLQQGSSEDTQDERSAAEQLLDVSAAYLKNETNSFPAPASPKEVWSDFMQIALGLLDGGSPRTGYPMPQVDGSQNPLVLENPERVVPALNSSSFVVPANIPVSISGVVISADDPYLALVALQQLDDALKLENSAALEAELTEQKNLLEHWMQSNSSFAWDVGKRIGENLNQARLRLRQISAGVSTKFSENRLIEAEKRARDAMWRMLKISGGIFVSVAGLCFTPLFPLAPLIIVGGILLFLWNLIGGIMFHRAIRDYFQVANQLDEEQKKHDHIMRQKLDFARDVQRLAVIYVQYQYWVRLLSETVYRPFGVEDLRHTGRVSPIRMLTDVTKSLSVGRLATNANDKEILVNGVKKKFFVKGWRTQNFNRLLEALGADPRQVFSDTGVGNNSSLARISKLTDRTNSREKLLDEAAKTARKLAMDSADYGSWPVLATGASSVAGGNTCQRFLNPMLASEKHIKTDLIKPGDVGTVNEIHTDGAHVYMDKRIPTGNPERVALAQLNNAELTDYQQLDYMAVRVERSVLFGYTSLAFLEKTAEEIDRDRRRAEATTEDPISVEG